MSRLFLLLACAVLLASCNSRSKRVEETRPLTIVDSLRIQEDMGRLVERVYEGTVPGADVPGIEYKLRLIQQQYTNNGVYELDQTYLEADGDKSKTFKSYGRWETLLSSSYDIVHLRPFANSDNTIAFYAVGMDTLQLLDQDMNPIDSQHNYILRSSREFIPLDEDDFR